MANIYIYESEIYTYYEKLIEFNLKSRANEDDITRTALNLNIILCSACLLEGILEDKGKLLLGFFREVYNAIEKPVLELRKPLNFYYNHLEKFINKKISQCTGLDNYSSLFELFTGTSLKQHYKVSPLIEGINVLFQLRNVIAHGRQVHACEIEAYYTDGKEEQFFGGYKKAEEYLIKNGFLSDKFICTENSKIYFTDEIADHFYSLTLKFIDALEIYISENIEISELLFTRANNYNTKYGTEYDVMGYLRMRGMKE